MTNPDQYLAEHAPELPEDNSQFLDSLAQEISAMHAVEYRDTPRKVILGFGEDEYMDLNTIAVAFNTKPEIIMQIVLKQFADKVYESPIAFDELKSRLKDNPAYRARALRERLLGTSVVEESATEHAD